MKQSLSQQQERLANIQDTLKLITKSKRVWKEVPRFARLYEKDIRFLLKLITIPTTPNLE